MSELLTWRRNPWSLFDEVESLHKDLSQLLSDWSLDWGRQGRAGYPPVNVWTCPEGLIVDMEVPGVDPRNVKVSVHEDELRIDGRINARDPQEGEVYLRRERPTGEFSRTIQLPFRANTSGVKATYKNGVLRVTVPRSEEDKPRLITVETA